MDALQTETILAALRDEHFEVVRHAVRLSEPTLEESLATRTAVLKLASHQSPRVRRQVAWSLGELGNGDAVSVLVGLASRAEPVAHVRSAVLTSIHRDNAGSMLRQYIDLPKTQQVPAILQQILKSAIRLDDVGEIEAAIRLLTREPTSFRRMLVAVNP